tara:strand:- start:948 stop:1628 length:681 start_codon:yes stop_codon:yes gene_type:complete
VTNLTLLIPANKEAESLPTFLNELINHDYKKMVVLQKEDEETINSIRDFKGIELIIQKNRGYGNALKEGLENVKTEFFCIINADGSMDPKYLKQMMRDCQNKDLVFASRYLKDGGSDDDNLVTFIGNKCFSFLGNLLFNLNLSDILYTYIVGRVHKVRGLDLKYNDFRICVEIPIRAKARKLIFVSTPSMERKRIAGVKKVNAIKDGFLILSAIMYFFFKKILRKN